MAHRGSTAGPEIDREEKDDEKSEEVASGEDRSVAHLNLSGVRDPGLSSTMGRVTG